MFSTSLLFLFDFLLLRFDGEELPILEPDELFDDELLDLLVDLDFDLPLFLLREHFDLGGKAFVFLLSSTVSGDGSRLPCSWLSLPPSRYLTFFAQITTKCLFLF